MIQQISSIENWQSLTAEQIHAALSVEVDQPAHTAVTLAMIIDAVGAEVYPLVRLTLESAAVPADDSSTARMQAAQIVDSLAAMRTVGLSFSAPERQAVIDGLAIAGGWPDTARDAIKRLGVRAVTTWERFGGVGEVPTEVAVADAIESDAASRRESVRIAALNDVMDAVRSNVDLSAASLSLADLQDAINDALANAWSV